MVRRRLFGIKLSHFPSGRNRQHHVPFQRNGIHGLDFIRFAVRRGIRVENRRKIRRGLRRGKHSKIVSAQLGKQRQCRCDLGNATMQSRPVLTVNVNHVFRRNVDRIVPRHIPDVAGMVLQNPVVRRISPTVIRDPVDTGIIFEPAQFTGNTIRLDQLQVQFHTVADFGIRCQHGKRFAILTAGHSHRPEFRSKTNGIRPAHECRFHSIIERLVGGKHLQSRTRTDGVVCEHLHQSSGVGIVGDFVARAHPQRPADFRRGLHVRRQMVRRRPVTPVVPCRLRRIKPGADKLFRRGSAPKNGFESVEHR